MSISVILEEFASGPLARRESMHGQVSMLSASAIAFIKHGDGR